jgi:hypothetical protein
MNDYLIKDDGYNFNGDGDYGGDYNGVYIGDGGGDNGYYI